MGWRKTFFELVPRYPGLILTPAFTNFTFGPVQSSESSYCGDSIGHSRTGQFGMSFDLSWINICISSTFMFFSTFITWDNQDGYLHSDVDADEKLVGK